MAGLGWGNSYVLMIGFLGGSIDSTKSFFLVDIQASKPSGSEYRAALAEAGISVVG